MKFEIESTGEELVFSLATICITALLIVAICNGCLTTCGPGGAIRNKGEVAAK